MITINHIWATGCYHRYVYLNINGKIYKCTTTDKCYQELKKEGIITAQSKKYKEINKNRKVYNK